MKRILFVLFCCSVFFVPTVGLAETVELPAVGDVYRVDKTEYKVVGVGTNPFEFVSSGESLEIKILNKIPGTIVITPKKGEIVKVDPSKPMVWIADAPHKEFVQNSFLKKSAKGKPFLLLEYIR